MNFLFGFIAGGVVAGFAVNYFKNVSIAGLLDKAEAEVKQEVDKI